MRCACTLEAGLCLAACPLGEAEEGKCQKGYVRQRGSEKNQFLAAGLRPNVC